MAHEHHDDHDHDHVHAHDHDDHPAEDKAHGHSHGVIDPSLFSTDRGIQALKWSLLGLGLTAALQLVVVAFTGSVGLLADTIHNLGDAFTALPLWLAFSLSKRPPTKRFTYGFGRAEDLAGVSIVLIILLSSAIAAYEAIDRLLHPQSVQYVWAVAIASVIGFFGNEAVAWYRIKVGKEIGSAALVADGYHARVDGLTSLAVLAGAIGVWLGFPLADPIVGLLITIAILKIVWDAGKSVLARMLDGVEPEVVDEIHEAAQHVGGVQELTGVRVRWLGHRLNAELNIAVDPTLTVDQAHTIALETQHELMHHLPYLSGVTIHVDPAHASGDDHHRIEAHEHDDLPKHSH